jgi:hypothetical protein
MLCVDDFLCEKNDPHTKFLTTSHFSPITGFTRSLWHRCIFTVLCKLRRFIVEYNNMFTHLRQGTYRVATLEIIQAHKRSGCHEQSYRFFHLSLKHSSVFLPFGL